MSGINSVQSPSPASVFLNKPQTLPASPQQEIGENPAVEASETQTKQVQEGEAAPKPSANRLESMPDPDVARNPSGGSNG